jgi:hypothetical protein
MGIPRSSYTFFALFMLCGVLVTLGELDAAQGRGAGLFKQFAQKIAQNLKRSSGAASAAKKGFSFRSFFNGGKTFRDWSSTFAENFFKKAKKAYNFNFNSSSSGFKQQSTPGLADEFIRKSFWKKPVGPAFGASWTGSQPEPELPIPGPDPVPSEPETPPQQEASEKIPQGEQPAGDPGAKSESASEKINTESEQPGQEKASGQNGQADSEGNKWYQKTQRQKGFPPDSKNDQVPVNDKAPADDTAQGEKVHDIPGQIPQKQKKVRDWSKRGSAHEKAEPEHEIPAPTIPQTKPAAPADQKKEEIAPAQEAPAPAVVDTDDAQNTTETLLSDDGEVQERAPSDGDSPDNVLHDKNEKSKDSDKPHPEHQSASQPSDHAPSTPGYGGSSYGSPSYGSGGSGCGLGEMVSIPDAPWSVATSHEMKGREYATNAPVAAAEDPKKYSRKYPFPISPYVELPPKTPCYSKQVIMAKPQLLDAPADEWPSPVVNPSVMNMPNFQIPGLTPHFPFPSA